MRKVKAIVFAFLWSSLLYSQHILPIRTVVVPTITDSVIIDGIADESSWSASSQIAEMYNSYGVTGDIDFSGYLRLCMDYNNLYLFVKVFDEIGTIYNGVTSPWDYDNIEVFLDLDTTFTNLGYDEDAIQYRFNYGSDTNTCIYPPRNGAVLRSKMEYSPFGYELEAAIPWISFMPEGSLPDDIMEWFDKAIGFDVQIADNDGDGRDGQAAWDADGDNLDTQEDNAWYNTTVFGIMQFQVQDEGLIADAGSDLVVDELSQVSLNGSGSSATGSRPFTYKWIAPRGIVIHNPDSESPSFTAPEVINDSIFIFGLKITNGSNTSAIDTLVVKVLNVNKPPVAIAGSDQNIYEGNLVYLDGSFSHDDDGEEITYQWTSLSNIVLDYDTIPNPSFLAPDVNENSIYQFSLIVSDGHTTSLPSNINVRVLKINNVPNANAGQDQSVQQGDLVILDGSNSIDVDNDDLVYEWSGPAAINLSGRTTVNPKFVVPPSLLNHSYIFQLIVNDGTINSEPDFVIIYANAPTSSQSEIESDLIIYPNPANRIINIQLSESVFMTNYMAFLIDSRGTLVAEKKFKLCNAQFEIPNEIKGGIYILQIYGDNGTSFNSRIIIEN